MDKFADDLDTLMGRLMFDCSPEELCKMQYLERRLIELRERNLLKINHSVMELIVAKYLVRDGYDVELEHTIDSGLNCDVYATKGDGVTIIEVETGYVPPAHALDPLDYVKARIAPVTATTVTSSSWQLLPTTSCRYPCSSPCHLGRGRWVTLV
jgi:hypothetical protein